MHSTYSGYELGRKSNEEIEKTEAAHLGALMQQSAQLFTQTNQPPSINQIVFQSEQKFQATINLYKYKIN